MASTREWFETVEEARRRARWNLPEVGRPVAGGRRRAGRHAAGNEAAFSELRLTPPRVADLPAVRRMATSALGQEDRAPGDRVADRGAGRPPRRRGRRGPRGGRGGHGHGPQFLRQHAGGGRGGGEPEAVLQMYWSGSKDEHPAVGRAGAAGRRQGPDRHPGLVVLLRAGLGSPSIPRSSNCASSCARRWRASWWPGHVSRGSRPAAAGLTVPNMAAPGGPLLMFWGVYGEWMQTLLPTWADIERLCAVGRASWSRG